MQCKLRNLRGQARSVSGCGTCTHFTLTMVASNLARLPRRLAA